MQTIENQPYQPQTGGICVTLRCFPQFSGRPTVTNPFKHIDPATFLEVASCLRCLCLASLKFLPWTWRLGHKTDLGDTRIIPMISMMVVAVVPVVLGSASHLRSGLYNPYIYIILPIFHPIYQWGYSIYNWGITAIKTIHEGIHH